MNGAPPLGSIGKELIRNFFYVGPHAGAHRVAIRAATCLAGPLLLLYAIDRLDLAIYASFGAFTGIYGRNDNYAQRLYMQATAGLAIVLAMLVGTFVSYIDAPGAIRVLTIAIVAAIITVFAFASPGNRPVRYSRSLVLAHVRASRPPQHPLFTSSWLRAAPSFSRSW